LAWLALPFSPQLVPKAVERTTTVVPGRLLARADLSEARAQRRVPAVLSATRAVLIRIQVEQWAMQEAHFPARAA
jgi:hypothetical protein